MSDIPADPNNFDEHSGAGASGANGNESDQQNREAPLNFTEAKEGSLSSELETWKSRAAYLAAEIDNMKKRAVRERADLIRSSNEGLLRALLPVFDNLDLGYRAVLQAQEKLDASMREHPMVQNLSKGMEMTLKSFEQCLEHQGVSFMDAVNKVFDPSLHEAMGQEVRSDLPAGQVVSVLQRGVMLNGRVLRSAKVTVNQV